MPPKPRYLRHGRLSRINRITRFSHRHSGEGRNPPRGRSAQPRPPYSHPNPPPSPSHPPRRRGQGGGYPIPHPRAPPSFPPAPLRHSRESGNLELGVQPDPVTPSLVIPTLSRIPPHSGESRNPSGHPTPHNRPAPPPVIPSPARNLTPPICDTLSLRFQRALPHGIYIGVPTKKPHAIPSQPCILRLVDCIGRVPHPGH